MQAQPGPWDNEPAHMEGEAHGLPWYMCRGPGGHWCGYVGIPADHPWHGKSESENVRVSDATRDRPIDVDKVGVINLFCAANKGDDIDQGVMPIALAIDVHGGLTWSADQHPEGEADGRWWFGFDCAHAGDLAPKYGQRSAFGGVYRDAAYVQAECESLAKQLAALQAAE